MSPARAWRASRRVWFSSLHAHLGALCCDKPAHVWSYPALQAEMLDTSVSSSHTNGEETETPGRKGCSWSREKVTGCVLCGPSYTLGLGPWGAVSWRGQGSGAWRGPQVTQRDSAQLSLAQGARPVGSLRPRVPLCGKRGSLSGGGVQRPHRVLEILYVEVVEEHRCQRKRSCVQAKSLRSGWALHSILGFWRRDDFESQLYSDHLLILGRPSYCLGSLAFSHVRWGQTHPVNVWCENVLPVCCLGFCKGAEGAGVPGRRKVCRGG